MNCRKRPLLCVLMLLLLVLCILVAESLFRPSIHGLFKVTDPADSKFESSKFSVEDYYFSDAELAVALRISIPLGMHESKVDSVLVDSSHLKKMISPDLLGKNRVEYDYEFRGVRKLIPRFKRFWISVEYDNARNVRQVYLKSQPIH